MRLLLTNDGVYGVDNGIKITWFDDVGEACMFGVHHKGGWIKEEFLNAVSECIKNHHDVAEFGVNGSLIYTSMTEGM